MTDLTTEARALQQRLRTGHAEPHEADGMIDRLLAEVERQWRPIETAPKDGVVLLASLAVRNAGNGPEWSITAGYWDDEFGYDHDEYRGAWTDDSVASWGYEERVELSPSHWMPLPAAPALKEQPQ